MKRMIIYCALFLIACTTGKMNADWNGGADRQQGYQQQQMEESMEDTKNELPSAAPATEMGQPF